MMQSSTPGTADGENKQPRGAESETETETPTPRNSSSGRGGPGGCELLPCPILTRPALPLPCPSEFSPSDVPWLGSVKYPRRPKMR